MGVYIPKMNIPKNCKSCDLSTWEGFPLTGLKLCCQLLGQVDDIEVRDEDCPFDDLPPHGRLIDADALQKEMYRKSFEIDDGRQKWDSGLWIRYKIFEESINNAPTVIEREC